MAGMFYSLEEAAEKLNKTEEEIKQIVDLELDKVRERLVEHAITLELSEEGLNWLVEKGYDPEYGARPLRRLLQDTIEVQLSDGILSGKYPLGGLVDVKVDTEADELILESEPEEEEEMETPGV